MALVQFDELDLLEELAGSLDTGTFVDVGASVGRFAQRFAENSWMVVAFEPVPDLAQEFRERVIGDRVHLFEKAVTDSQADTIQMYISGEHWGIHSLAAFHPSHTTSIEVEVGRLDSQEIRSLPMKSPVILKIDTEGADYPALRTWSFDESLPKVVVTEFMDARSRPHFGYSYLDVVTFMSQKGYASYVSEWSGIEGYSVRGGQSNTGTVHLGVSQTPLNHEPAWGNLIFVSTEDREWFETHLVSYLGKLNRELARLASESGSNASRSVNLEASLENRERRVEALLETLEARDRRIAELDSAIVQRDRRIAELDSAIVRRNRRIDETYRM